MSEPIQGQSRLFGVSIRGWLAVMMTFTVCVLAPTKIEVKEPLYSGFLMGLGFYLGQKKSGQDAGINEQKGDVK